MYSRDLALNDIFSCIEKINEQLPSDSKIPVDINTIFIGEGSNLESLTLINLMVEIEETVNSSSQKRLPILEGALMSKNGVQFKTASELAKWIAAQF